MLGCLPDALASALMSFITFTMPNCAVEIMVCAVCTRKLEFARRIEASDSNVSMDWDDAGATVASGTVVNRWKSRRIRSALDSAEPGSISDCQAKNAAAHCSVVAKISRWAGVSALF